MDAGAAVPTTREQRIGRKRERAARINAATAAVAVVVGCLICFLWGNRPGWADGLLVVCAWLAIEGAFRYGQWEGIELARRVPDFEKHWDDD